jgi:F420-dependent oxidoreductase-like protein
VRSRRHVCGYDIVPQIKRLTFKTKPEDTTWSAIADVWQEAERIELLDGGWLFDHFYPIYGDKAGPCFEGWTALSYLAGRTQRLRLGIMVTGNPYRHPAVLANMAATFDHFSNGRLDLGIGAGWNEEEANAYGTPLLPIRQRLDQFEEACAVLQLLLTRPTADFAGQHYRLVQARCEPKPIQKPYPPLVMGGTGEKRFLRIAARFADDWNYPGGSPEDFRHKVEVLHRHCEAVGRNPTDITLSCHIFVAETPDETAAQAVAYAEAGAQHLCLYFITAAKPELLGPTAEAVAGAVGLGA